VVEINAIVRGCAASALAGLLAACGPSGQAGPGGPGGGTPPPPSVGVITVQTAPLALADELPGRLEASRVAQVRARVTGIVVTRRFTEGALVTRGQSLFEIDAAPYKAALDSAQAAQARAEAGLAQAAATFERNRPLLAAKAISQQEWLASEAANKQALADVATAKAAVTQARLALDYTAVDAPITGRIGRALVSEGALVTQAEATPMALVQQVDPLYVNIVQPAGDALRLKHAVESGRMKAVAQAKVQVVLEDGSIYARPAKLLFTDWTVDASSGQVSLRAVVPNPDGDLLPGRYVKVRVEQAQTESAILVPQQSVTRTAAGDRVMVVGSDDIPAQRPVQLGGSRGSQWIVLGGLQPGERVMADGFQKIRPRMPVHPVPWSPAGSAAAAASAAPATAASAPR